jgi:hypothetical protein
MEKFWMVMLKGGGYYTLYPNYEAAKKGAEESARLNDAPFVVLEAMEVVTPQQTPVEWKKL